MTQNSHTQFNTYVKIKKCYVTDERRIDNRNKDVNIGDLGFINLPGGENQFDGDDL